MKIFIGYQCSYDYCDVWQCVEKLFDDELKARAWKEAFKASEVEWRSYEAKEVE